VHVVHLFKFLFDLVKEIICGRLTLLKNLRLDIAYSSLHSKAIEGNSGFLFLQSS